MFALLCAAEPASVWAAGMATSTPGPWDLFRGTSKVSTHATEGACINAAVALNVARSYTCRTSTAVSVTITAPPAPVNCVVSAFGAWVETGRTTAGAVITITEQRTRTVVAPAANGGTACPALVETRTRTEAVVVTPPDPPVPSAGEWSDTFVFPTEVPAPFVSPNWEIQRYSRDRETWVTPEMMMADHGATTCGGPPESHHIATYEDMVFRCRDHVMTAIKAGGYGVIILTPNRMLDWANAPATLSFNLSTKRNTKRDWMSFYLTPYEDALAVPAPEDAVSLNGQPRNAVWILHTAEGNLCARVIRDFKVTNLPCIDYWKEIEDKFIAMGSTASASRRDPVVITVSRTHLTVSWADMKMVDTDFPEPLTFARGVVQLGHYSYNPMKDCEFTPQFSCNANTWHWDDVKLSNALPFTIVGSSPRAVVNGDGEFTLNAPAPANAMLRFSVNNFEVDVAFDGGPWVKPKALSYVRVNDPDGQFTVAIPEGTTKIRTRRDINRPVGWIPRDLGYGSQVRDVSVWAR